MPDDTTPAAPADQQLTLPFNFFGLPVVETKFSLSGAIHHPEAQPPCAFTNPGERHIFVVVAYFAGQATEAADDRSLTWSNKFNLAEAYEITEVDDLSASNADELVEVGRASVRAELDAQLAGAAS